jgi:hypothetical protein
LVKLWLAEKRAAGESVEAPSEVFFSTIEISESALQSAWGPSPVVTRRVRGEATVRFARGTAASHGRQTYVAIHTKDVPSGTFRSILKQAKLTEEEFRNL